jgi:hypothetical protein
VEDAFRLFIREGANHQLSVARLTFHGNER